MLLVLNFDVLIINLTEGRVRVLSLRNLLTRFVLMVAPLLFKFPAAIQILTTFIALGMVAGSRRFQVVAH